MRRVTSIALASAAAVLALCAATVGAQQSNVQEVTYLTFSHAVELPGVTLEPGSYEFRLADSPQRNVIQVFSRDRSEVMGQWTFVQSRRPRTSDETVVMFRETAEGATPAVQYWYYPGEQVGKEFVYPKDQGERIAARTGQTVSTDEGPVSPPAAVAGAQGQGSPPAGTSAARATGDVARADDGAARDAADLVERDAADADADVAARGSSAADGTVRTPSVFAPPTVPAGSTTGVRSAQDSERAAAGDDAIDRAVAADVQREQSSEVASRQVSDPDAPRPVPTSGAAEAQASGSVGSERPGELPRTASPLALAGLIGLLSLGGAAALRRFYR
jgi:hypothetical protein